MAVRTIPVYPVPNSWVFIYQDMVTHYHWSFSLSVDHLFVAVRGIYLPNMLKRMGLGLLCCLIKEVINIIIQAITLITLSSLV